MKIGKSLSFDNNNNNISEYCNKTSYEFYRPTNNKIERLFMRSFYPSKNQPKLFSLLDINDKITNSRGTSLPIQFKRLSNEETKRQFGFSFQDEHNYRLTLIRNYLNNIHPSKYKKKILEDTKKKLDKTQKNRKNKPLEIKIENNNKEKNSKVEKLSVETENEKVKRKVKTEANNPKLKIKNRNDVWLPKGYGSYELLVNNHILLLKQIKEDPFSGKLPYFSLKKIKTKSYESDIFFTKPNTDRNDLKLKKNKIKDYLTSDIFNMKNDENNLYKTSENFLFKPKDKEKYGLTRESNSKWSPKISFPTFLNSPSIEYNILCPDKKNIGNTKENILNKIKEKKNKNIENEKLDKKVYNSINYMNPIFRQKGLGEFIDITRNGGNNTGKNFIEWYKRDPNCFAKYNETCSSFYDSYKYYKDICDKPFILNPSLKYKQ